MFCTSIGKLVLLRGTPNMVCVGLLFYNTTKACLMKAENGGFKLWKNKYDGLQRTTIQLRIVDCCLNDCLLEEECAVTLCPWYYVVRAGKILDWALHMLYKRKHMFTKLFSQELQKYGDFSYFPLKLTLTKCTKKIVELLFESIWKHFSFCDSKV